VESPRDKNMDMSKNNKKIDVTQGLVGDINPSFFRTRVKFGLVCLASLQDIEEIQKSMARHPDVKIIYTKVSLGKLRIVEGST